MWTNEKLLKKNFKTAKPNPVYSEKNRLDFNTVFLVWILKSEFKTITVEDTDV